MIDIPNWIIKLIQRERCGKCGEHFKSINNFGFGIYKIERKENKNFFCVDNKCSNCNNCSRISITQMDPEDMLDMLLDHYMSVYSDKEEDKKKKKQVFNIPFLKPISKKEADDMILKINEAKTDIEIVNLIINKEKK